MSHCGSDRLQVTLGVDLPYYHITCRGRWQSSRPPIKNTCIYMPPVLEFPTYAAYVVYVAYFYDEMEVKVGSATRLGQ